MKRISAVAGLILLSACSSNARMTHYESADNLAATSPLSCVAAASIGPGSSAADITAGAKNCVRQSKYERAAEMVMVASAYAFYDTQRVADRTAHGALNALFAKEFGTMSEKNREALLSSVDALDEDMARKQEVCTALEESGPPAYMPRYMIAHGMAAFTGRGADPLVADFDSGAGWAKALGFVRCG